MSDYSMLMREHEALTVAYATLKAEYEKLVKHKAEPKAKSVDEMLADAAEMHPPAKPAAPHKPPVHTPMRKKRGRPAKYSR